MAKVTDLDIDNPLFDLMLKSVRIKHRLYETPVVHRKLMYSRQALKRLQSYSLMNEISDLWWAQSYFHRQYWETIAQNTWLNGYQYFLQEMSYRIVYGLKGLPRLSDKFQYKVYKFKTHDSYCEIDLSQHHLCDEWGYGLRIKNPGQKNSFTPTMVIEECTLPLLVEFNYLMNIHDYDPTKVLQVFVKIDGYKDDVFDTFSYYIDLPQQSGWQTFSQEFDPDLDTVDDYTFGFYSDELKGEWYIDNINLFHDGQNWAYDPTCEFLGEEVFYPDGLDETAEFPFVDQNEDVYSFKNSFYYNN